MSSLTSTTPDGFLARVLLVAALSGGLTASAGACADDQDDDAEVFAGSDVGADGVPRWEAMSVADEAGSTHLWIVARAVDLLAQHGDVPRAAAAAARLDDPTCRARWQQGLYDADYKKQYNGGWFDLSPSSSTATIGASGATWAAHFYDPDTGKNYKGKTSPTARTEALAHLSQARSRLAAGNVNDGCYELGLALHFMTDLTQPMHAALYTATDWPLKLHSHVEGYAMELQGGFVIGDLGGVPSGTASDFLVALAKRSKARWAGLRGAVAAAYGARCDAFDSYWIDHPECWEGDAAVDAGIVESMRAAIHDTAGFLIVANLP